MNCIYNIFKKTAFNIPSANWNYIEAKWVVKDFSFVKKDEVLGSVVYKYIPLNRILPTKEQVFNIVSPCDGYLYIQQDGLLFINKSISESDNELLAIVFDNCQELLSNYYCCEGSTLETDPYTGHHEIEFNYLDGFHRKEWKRRQEEIMLDDFHCFKVEFYEDKMLF